MRGSGSPSFVQCELSIHSLNTASPPSYTALSYVWGPESTDTIFNEDNALILNDETVPARENLLHALRSFQRRNDKAYLWVDAVCINQSDMEEKKTQIALMGQIYSAAERTVIWLGKKEGDSDLAIDFIRRVKAEDFEVGHFDHNTRCLRAVMAVLQRAWCESFTFRENTSRPIIDLKYSGTRVWILQEAFLSKLPVARCGDEDVHFERFVTLKQLHDDAYKKSPTRWRDYMLFQNIRFVYCLSNWEITRSELATKGGASPFSWMASTSSRLLSTVPHDKIYGILGMCTPEDQANINVDYDKPLREVIIDVVVRSLKSEGFMCLSHVLPAEIRTPDLELPSWVPDLMALDLTQNLSACNYKADISAVDPAWERLPLDPNITANEATLAWSCVRKHEILILYGCLCDVVTFADPMPVVPQYEGFDVDLAEQAKAARVALSIETFRKWEKLALEDAVDNLDAYKKVRGGRRDAFWRTLSCDSGVKGVQRPLPEDFGDRYESLLGRLPPPNSSDNLQEPMKNAWVREFGVPACAKCVNKSFFLTQQGRMGVATRGVKKGDMIIIARGGSVPYIIRLRPDWGMTFVGEAYLHGVMDGEGLLDAVRQGANLFKFHLR